MGVPSRILAAVDLPAEKVQKMPAAAIPAPERSDSDVEREEDNAYFAEVEAELKWSNLRDAAMDAWDDVQCYLQNKSAAILDRGSFTDFETFCGWVFSVRNEQST